MRYLVILSLLWVAISASPAHALETPPNVRWQRNVTAPADTNTTTRLTDCKLLSNGNLAITGQFTGTGPILGSPHHASQDPTNGTFVALQSPAGDLLWLHRFAGQSQAQLGTDESDNIHLINYTIEAVSLLGTNLPVEADSALVYHVSFKPDGTLNQLRPLGQMAGALYNQLVTARTSCYPEGNTCLVALEFNDSIELAGESFTTAEGQAKGVLWAKFLPDGSLAWSQLFSSEYTALSSFLPLPDGSKLGFVGFYGPGSFQGQTYDAPAHRSHSLLVWLDSTGQVTKTARIYGEENDAFISGVARASDGDLILQIVGNGEATIKPQTGPALHVPVAAAYPDYMTSVTIARLAGDLSTLRWHIDSGEGWLVVQNNLHCDQAGNIYVAFNTTFIRFNFGDQLLKPVTYEGYEYHTILLKLSPAGQFLWGRYQKGGYSSGFDIAPDGVGYATANELFSSNLGRVISFGSSLESSPPEFFPATLTNQVASAGSTLYFTPALTGGSNTVYYWFKDGVAFTNSPVSQLVISNVSAGDLGSYTLTASNEFGAVSAGPYTFTLGLSSKLSSVQQLQYIETGALESIRSTFSPSGQRYLSCIKASYLFLTNPPYVTYFTNQIVCRTAVRDQPVTTFSVSQPGTIYTPLSLIAEDGSCFFAGTYASSPLYQSRSWLVCTDSSGHKLWEIDVASATGGYFEDITLFQNTNLVLSAYCKQGTVFPGRPPLPQSGTYLVYLSFAGTVLDTKLLLLNETESGGELHIASDGSGYLLTRNDAAITIPGGETFPRGDSNYTLLFRFDAAGQVRWGYRLPTAGFNLATACDADGVVISLTCNDHAEMPGIPPLDFAGLGIVVVRWNKDGQPEWHKLFTSPSPYNYVRNLTMDAGGNIVMGLVTSGDIMLDDIQVPANTEASPENLSQPILARLTRTGRVLDAFRISVNGPADIQGLDIDPIGRVLFSGSIATYQAPLTKLQIGPYTLQQDLANVGGFYGITAPLGPPLLTQHQGNELKLNWSEYLSGFHLESSPSPLGPWNPVSTTTNSVTLDTSSTTGQFFRLKEQTE